MNTIESGASKPTIKRFYSPSSITRSFIARKTLKNSLIWGVIFALYIISKASSFIKVYPTELSREKLAETLGNNIGIEALLGVAHNLETVSGYVVWNFLCLIAAAGSIWAFLIATKTFRGEEDAGRWELFLAGQTTARKAAINALAGLGSGLVLIYIFISLAVIYVGHLHGSNFTLSASLFFSLALIAGAAEFLAIGALASQLMPVRGRAVGLSAATFGVFYMMRLAADTTSAHWLLDVSPLGWIEKLQPMYNSQLIWLLPIGLLILGLCILTVFFAGQRDLGVGIFADKDTAKAHTALLNTPFLAALRLTRATTIGWLVAIGVMAFLYGLLSKGATQALSQSAKIEKAISHIAAASNASLVSAFMGIIFLLIMLVVMFYAANAINKIRSDEANGYIDNFLVRAVSRMQWLWGRILLVTLVIIGAGILSGIAAWAGEASQHGGVPFHSLLLAGLNVMSPVMFILGLGILAMGILPRLTSAITYGFIAWSFLIVMLSSGLNLNHWLLDTSVLHQINLAPATNANWTVDAALVGIAIVFSLIGAIAFNNRDLASE